MHTWETWRAEGNGLLATPWKGSGEARMGLVFEAPRAPRGGAVVSAIRNVPDVRALSHDRATCRMRSTRMDSCETWRGERSRLDTSLQTFEGIHPTPSKADGASVRENARIL